MSMFFKSKSDTDRLKFGGKVERLNVKSFRLDRFT